MALYREGLSVNLVPYKVLAFFKIINALHDKGAHQTKWINDNLAKITDRDAKKRLGELQASESDVGDYLYKSGRCAVAHAFSESVVNPDDPADVQRMAMDLPLIRALAEYAIEHEFHVQSVATFHREHLYELEGFRELFGQQLVEQLRAGATLQPDRLPLPARLSLKLREKDQLPSFEGMEAVVANVANGIVQIHLSSPDGRIHAMVDLHFPDESLRFDALCWLRVSDDGSPEAARSCIDELSFCKDWMANGVTEVWDSSTGKRLGRSQPVYPVNVRPDWDAIDREMAELQSRISRASDDAPPPS